jgi:hypothetical protein
MARTLTPNLRLTSINISTTESYGLNVSDTLTVESPLVNTSIIATSVAGVTLHTIAMTKPTWLYAQNKDTTDTITILHGAVGMALLGPGEICFYKTALNEEEMSLIAKASANTPEIEFGYWTAG